MLKRLNGPSKVHYRLLIDAIPMRSVLISRSKIRNVRLSSAPDSNRVKLPPVSRRAVASLRKDVCLVASLFAQKRVARVRINTGSGDTSVEKCNLIERVSNGGYRSVPERSDGKYTHMYVHLTVIKYAIIAFPANFTSRESVTQIDTKKVSSCVLLHT